MKLKLFHEKITHLTWAVRIVELNDKYGLNGCLVNTEGNGPLVEFYDTRYEHTDLGQFVSRYFIDTLTRGEGGLNLDGCEPEWTIHRPCMHRIRDWLRRQA